MRIAFFVNYSHTAGTYFRWHNLALGLKRAGHEVDVYAGDHDFKKKVRHEIRDGIDYYITPAFLTSRIFYNPNDPFSSIRRLSYLPEKKYDVYHLFQPFLSAYMPWKALKKKNKTGVFLYDWDDLWTGGLFRKPKTLRETYLQKVTAGLEKNIPFAADGITACSDFLAKKVHSNSPVQIVGNGFWPGETPSKAEMRKKWQLQDGLFYIAYIGKTADELDWMIKALQQAEDPRVRLVIVGPPKKYVDNHIKGYEDRVSYLGEVSSAEAKEIATAVDLGLIPLEDSLFNQSRFPIKFFDFLTVGTPIYLSDVGEIAKIGKDMEGVILGAADKQGWINGINKAIQQASGLSVAAAQLLNNYSWPVLASRQADFYSSVIESKNSEQ